MYAILIKANCFSIFGWGKGHSEQDLCMYDNFVECISLEYKQIKEVLDDKYDNNIREMPFKFCRMIFFNNKIV